MEKENTIDKQYTAEDAIADAKKLAEPSEKKEKRKKYFFENLASLISIFVIALSIVLYSYNSGFCKVYNLPESCMPLDLRSYIPVAISLLCLMLVFSFYLSYIKTDIALKRKQFNLIRILYGLIIIGYLIRINNINQLLSAKIIILISLLSSLLIELCVYLFLLCYTVPRQNRPISRFEYKQRLENFVHDRFIYSYLVKYGVFIMIFATLIAPVFGKLSANTKHLYQITEKDSFQYAVIVEYSDRVLVQPATIEAGALHINTNRYEYLPKDNLNLQYTEFETVIIEK